MSSNYDGLTQTLNAQNNGMTELIPISEHNGKRAVSARELHAFLESQRQFGNWIQERIEKYGFIENQDFEVFNNFVKNPNGGRPLTEYALSIDMAKELSMVEGNEKGKIARQYFIACEKKAKNPLESITRKDLAKMLLESEEEKERLLMITQDQGKLIQVAQSKINQQHEIIEIKNDEIKQLLPDAEYARETLKSISTFTATQIAKELGMSAKALNKKLHDMGVQYFQSGQWLLYAKYQDKGYTETSTYSETIDGITKSYHLTVWTEKGRRFIFELLKVEVAA